MLTQANHWLDIVGTALDAVLLGRVLLLRLYRLYVFITLGCVLAVFFDVVTLWLEPDVKASANVFIYSKFLYAVLFPLIAWDVFEEIGPQIAKLRRLAIARLISGLLFACLFGVMVSIFVDTTDANGETAVMATLSLLLWAGSSTATLAFLWTLHRQTRTQKIELPNNTHVWLVFWELSLLAEVLTCVWFLVVPVVKNHGFDESVQLVFSLYEIAITAWCVLKLRGIASSVPSEPANAGL